MRQAILLGFALFMGVASASAQTDIPPELIRYPDTILHNGKILTVDADFRIAEAVAIRDGVFLTVGTNQDVLRLRGPATRVIDLGGKTTVPGFVGTDADNDFVGGNLYKDTLINGRVLGTLRDVTNREQILAKVREVIASRPRGETIFLRLPDEGADGMRLTKADIDPLSPNHPLAMNVTSFDMVVNSLMLERVVALLPGGVNHPSVVKDAQGRPNGQIFGHAMGVAGWDLRPWPVIDEAVLAEQKQMLHDLNRKGITTMVAHLQGFNLTVLNVLYHNDELTMRVFATHDFLRQNPNAEAYLRRIGNLVDFGLGDMVQIVGAGLAAMDGNADSGSALTIDPKLRSGGIAFGPNGQNTWIGFGPHNNAWATNQIPKELTEWNNVRQAIKHGWNTTGIHNVGDQSTEIWLQTIEDAMKQPDIKLRPEWRPFGLDHNLFWNPQSFSKIEELDFRRGLGKMFQRPEVAVELYGDRIHDAQPVPELIARGFKVHIEGTDPFVELERYITRRDDQGRMWGPDYAVDRPTALRMKTIWAARYIAEDDVLGSIERGKKADLAVLGADFLTVREDDIERIPVVMTVVGGKIVYQEQ